MLIWSIQHTNVKNEFERMKSNLENNVPPLTDCRKSYISLDQPLGMSAKMNANGNSNQLYWRVMWHIARF